ncbi:hypothetical protein B296_00003132 [Ensete ventricosum]|uniref:Uncharacterized protein n=1 Tax=Ensete ventricosum TaxID=4639 RepID=A0A426ZLF2_ENSVE|nr:hypothetical protein B296_00003132 [Ensete ventricosum]
MSSKVAADLMLQKEDYNRCLLLEQTHPEWELAPSSCKMVNSTKKRKWAPKNYHSYPPQTQIRLIPLEILSDDNPHSKRRHDYYYRATTWQPV